MIYTKEFLLGCGRPIPISLFIFPKIPANTTSSAFLYLCSFKTPTLFIIF